MFDELGERLIELVEGACADCILVAPYIKRSALTRVIATCPPSTRLRVVTRWRLEEVALGVSDLDVWKEIDQRLGAELWLSPSLHAKYYRGDQRLLVGSANLTNTALGWAPTSNLEILIAPSEAASLQGFENHLFGIATRVDEELYRRFVEALAELPIPPPEPLPEVAVPEIRFEQWRPQLRFPSDLYTYYSGKSDALTRVAASTAAEDLAALSPPAGLSEPTFRRWVGLQLLQHPEFQAIREFIVRSRRFGEMRSFLSDLGAGDGTRAWQTWMRWLTHFLPNEFVFTTANYSELVERAGARKPTPR